MTDKEFCIEFAKRLNAPPLTVSSKHIVNIALYNTPVERTAMYSDIQIERLFTGDNVYQDVYKYVRDHQEEFLK